MSAFARPFARPLRASRIRPRKAPPPPRKHGCPMTPVRPIRRACALLSFLALAAWPALAAAAPAAAPAPAPNDTCFMCHADKDAKSSAGKSIAVDADRFKKSVHGEMQLKCTDCHSRRVGAEAAARREAEARQLQHLPRQGGGRVRRHGARNGAQGRQRRRGQLHGLPRQPRHRARQGRRRRRSITPTSRRRARSATAATRSSRRASCPAATSAPSSTTASTARR